MIDSRSTDVPQHLSANRIEWRPVVITLAFFTVLSAWMAVASKGFLEADGITHYLARRFALNEPLHLVGVWSRPLCVAMYALPAQLGGLVGVRLTSLFLTIILAALTLAVARQSRIGRPSLAVVFLLTQPLLFAHSFSELTEIPFALMLIAGFWAYQCRWFFLLAVIAALCPLARPEGFGLLVVVGVALILHRKWWWIAILPLGLLAWTYAGWRAFGGPDAYPWYTWLPRNWPYSGESMYGSGSPFWFVIVLPAIVGPLAFPVIGFGAWAMIRFGTFGGGWADRFKAAANLFWNNHAYRCRLLLAIIPIGVLIGHSVLWTFGKMASSGEPRYLLIVAPFWALLAAAGWQGVVRRLHLKHAFRPLIAAAVLPIAINFFYPAFPIRAQAEDALAVEVRAWLAERPEVEAAYPKLAASLPHLFIQMDIDRLNYDRVVDSSQKTVKHPPPGVMLVWDTIYSTHNASAEYCVTDTLLAENGWVPAAVFRQRDKVATVYLSPTDAAGNSTPMLEATRLFE
ncbi:MAG TPA: hypothetical protein VGB55_01500 [Tepidisphaeraceae bacterium]